MRWRAASVAVMRSRRGAAGSSVALLRSNVALMCSRRCGVAQQTLCWCAAVLRRRAADVALVRSRRCADAQQCCADAQQRCAEAQQGRAASCAACSRRSRSQRGKRALEYRGVRASLESSFWRPSAVWACWKAHSPVSARELSYLLLPRALEVCTRLGYTSTGRIGAWPKLPAGGRSHLSTSP